MTEPSATPNYGWGMLCHLSALCMLLGIPLGHVLGPLLVWLFKRASDPFADLEGKESLNFQISMSLYVLVAIPLCLFVVGFFLIGALIVADVVLVIVAAVKTSKGTPYRYPLTFRLIQ